MKNETRKYMRNMGVQKWKIILNLKRSENKDLDNEDYEEY